MEACKYKGEICYASEMSLKFKTQDEIRAAEADLRCIDDECNQEVRFFSGEIQKPHFRHKARTHHCAYEEYIKKENAQKSSARKLLYDVFLKRNYKVKQVFKVFKNHYAPLVIELDDNKLLAIEMIDKRTNKKTLDNWSEKYKEANIEVQWIYLTDDALVALYGRAYFSYMYAMENSPNNEVVIIHLNESESEKSIIEIHKKYKPSLSRNESIFKRKKEDPYSLCLENNKVTLEGFSTFFKKQTEEEIVKRNNINRNREKTRIPASEYTDEEYNKQLEYVLQRYKDADDTISIRDQNENIWLVCSQCGTFDLQIRFGIINESAWLEKKKYTLPNSNKLGICKDCLNNSHS